MSKATLAGHPMTVADHEIGLHIRIEDSSCKWKRDQRVVITSRLFVQPSGEVCFLAMDDDHECTDEPMHVCDEVFYLSDLNLPAGAHDPKPVPSPSGRAHTSLQVTVIEKPRLHVMVG